MSNSNLNFTIKFFRPPQRAVSCHNGLLDTRTKRTIAQDRLIVAEQRTLDVEQRKSASNLQLINYEQKQLEKRLLSLQNLEQSSQIRRRSKSETNLHRITSVSEIQHQSIEQIAALRKSDQNLSQNSDTENDDDDEEEENFKSSNKRTIPLPIVTIISPEENIVMFL